MTNITTAEHKSKKTKRVHKPGHVLKELLVLLIVVVGIIPLVWVVFLSLKSNTEIFSNPLSFPEEVQWIIYKAAFEKIPWGKMLRNTFTEMAIGLPVGMIFSFLSSFAIARVRFGNDKWNDAFYTYFLAGIIIPSFVLLFPVYQLVEKIGLYDNIIAMSLVHISWCAPMNTVIMVNAFRGIPNELEEAAVIDGCGIWKLLCEIYLPLIKSTLVTIFILSFIGIWNDFVLAKTLMISNEHSTISMAASLFRGLYASDYASMTAAIVILIVPQLIVFATMQKQIVDGITAGAVKG